jgi:hypothetical protein
VLQCSTLGNQSHRFALAEGVEMKLDFLMAVATAGFLATYFHLVFALVADRVGLAKVDLAKGTGKLLFGDSYDGDPPYLLGVAAVQLNGIIFGLVYATVIGPMMAGPNVLRGLAFGGLLYLYAQCIHVPIFMKGGLFSHKVHRLAWLTTALAHVIYGIILGWLSPLL